METRILCAKCFPENRAVYEITWKNMARRVHAEFLRQECGRTHSECLLRIPLYGNNNYMYAPHYYIIHVLCLSYSLLGCTEFFVYDS